MGWGAQGPPAGASVHLHTSIRLLGVGVVSTGGFGMEKWVQNPQGCSSSVGKDFGAQVVAAAPGRGNQGAVPGGRLA